MAKYDTIIIEISCKLMEQNKYLNEEQYQQNAKKLKKVGKIVLIIGIGMLVLGIVFLVLGFVGFGKTGISIASAEELNPEKTANGVFRGFGLFALGGFLDTSGLFVTGIGGIIMLIAHKREITAFTTQQVMPVAKEGINEMAPTIGNAAGEIAKGIKKGLNEADKGE